MTEKRICSSEKSVCAISALLFTVFAYKDRNQTESSEVFRALKKKNNRKSKSEKEETNQYDLTSRETNQNQSQPSISMRYFLFFIIFLLFLLAMIYASLSYANILPAHVSKCKQASCLPR